MSLKDQIKQDRLYFRKEKAHMSSSILGVVLGEIDTAEKRTGDALPDDKVVHIIKKLIESCEATGSDGEVAVLKAYLPKQLTTMALMEVIHDFVHQHPDTNIGEVMKYLKSEYAGRYDGGEASKIARDML